MLSHYIHYDLQLEEINKGIRQFLRYEASQASEFFMAECRFYELYVRYLPNLNYLQIHRIALWWEINEKIPIPKVHVHSCIHSIITSVFLAIIFNSWTCSSTILKCLWEAADIYNNLMEAFKNPPLLPCGCGFRYSNIIHHFLCWKWKYFYKFFLWKPWVCIFVLGVNITWNITICPPWETEHICVTQSCRIVITTDHGIVDVARVGLDHGLCEARLHHVDHALLRIQHL